jgi:2,3-bisphosphoglycerate-independent phosphoglycerate mutase
MNIEKSILVILDGLGIAPAGPYNAISVANAPTLHRLLQNSIHSQLITHGEEVGLPQGVMGNSEVGHMNIGSGRIVWQELSRINKEIREGNFQKNPVILSSIQLAREQKKRLHLVGLLSDGGVHSHQEHLFEILKLCKSQGLRDVVVHPLLDGRDTAPNSGVIYLERLVKLIQNLGIGVIGTIAGRYFGMDRDQRWDRVQKAYMAFWGEGPVASECDPVAVLKQSYAKGINDEFVEPTVILSQFCFKPEDEVLFFNFRADRMREIVAAVGEKDFTGFARSHPPMSVSCLTSYNEHFSFPVAYATNSLTHILGEVIADAGLRQFRIAETEKYAHVTFFFNGGKEAPMAGEERVLIPSPRDVATYDKKPAMSALEVSKKLVEAIASKQFSFLVANFANADMVGHTGIFAAAVRAIETLDKCLQQIEQAAKENGYHLFISADHGNVEQMQDVNGIAHTQHTLNPVPFIYVPPVPSGFKLHNGILADIMPTILTTMHLPIPKEVTGRNLFL